MTDKEQIEEIARDIAKKSCYLYDNCPKEHKHNCISQDPEIMLESSKNYITIATWLVKEGYHKTIWHKVADGDLPNEKQNVLISFKGFQTNKIVVISGFYLKGDFMNENSSKIRKDHIIAWTELPEYEE